jgi:hypothetical protein
MKQMIRPMVFDTSKTHRFAFQLPLLLILCALVVSRAQAQASDQLNAICAGIDNSYECAQAIERHQLEKPEYKSAASRAGTNLQLKLRNGRSLPFKDFQKQGDEASVVKYSFRNYLQDIGYFLLHRQFYEGNDYLMIQDTNGRKFELQDLPVISPDKLRLVTASNGISGGYNANAVQIWRLSKGGMVLEQTISPKGWGPSDAEWTDNLTIRVSKSLPVTGESEAPKATATLRFRGRWRLEAPAKN